MKIFSRHILWNNLQVTGICLLTCTGIYLLVDVFDRLDRMLERGAELWEISIYFGAKIPYILSEILPAVVFIALAVQISGMRKRREIMALEAGGISFYRLVLMVLLVGLLWTGGQFAFSQVLGVYGQQMSEGIWDSLGSDGKDAEDELSDIWVRNNKFVMHFDQAWPAAQRAQGVVVYALDDGFRHIERLVQADSLQKTEKGWQLRPARILHPDSFTFSQQGQLALPIDLNLRSLQVSTQDIEPEDMTLWELSSHIERLQDSGTNVETLRTAWHLKLSYAFSSVLLAAVALVLTRRFENLFLCISIGLGAIFFLLTVHTVGGTLGKSGMLPPWIGAWLGNALVGSLTAIVLGVQIRGRV